jgi:hypothetical protein
MMADDPDGMLKVRVFWTRKTLPNLPNDHPNRAAVQGQISLWQTRRNQLTQECQKRNLKFDFLSNDGL